MRYEIAGARGPALDPRDVLTRAQAWAAERHASVLLADAAVVFGRDHLESAVMHALRAQNSKTGVARDIGLETLRYLCGRRQVSDAIRVGGLKSTSETQAVVIFGSSADALLAHLGWSRDDAVLDPGGKSLRILGVTREEERSVPRDRVTDLALERTALLDIEK